MHTHTRQHRLNIVALFSGLLLLLNGFHPAYAQAENPLIEASKAETKGLLVYGDLTRTQIEPLIEAFNAKYPWIKVDVVDTDDFAVFEEYREDLENEERPADVLISGALDEWEVFHDDGMLALYKSPAEATMPDFAKDDLGIYMIYSDPSLLIWNKSAVKAPPNSLEGLAKLVDTDATAYKNAIATYDARRSEVGFDLFWSYLRAKGDKAWTVFDRIGKAGIRPETNSEKLVNDVVTGESKVAFFVEASAIHEHLDSQNLGWASLRDGMPVAEYFTGITKHAVSPNSAKLWIDFALSVEGQTALAKGGLPAYRPELRGKVNIHLDDFLENTTEADLIFFDFDKDIESEDKELAFLDRWRQAFQLPQETLRR